jgi:hypothetical protein
MRYATTQAKLVAPLSAIVRAPADPNGFAIFLLSEHEEKSYASAQTALDPTNLAHSDRGTVGPVRLRL